MSTRKSKQSKRPKHHTRDILIIAILIAFLVGLVILRLATQDSGEVSQYYPELVNTPATSGTIRATVTVKWFNFTPVEFNQDAAQATYTFFEKLGEQTGSAGFDIDHKTSTLFWRARTDKVIVLFIVSGNAPRPQWSIDRGDFADAATLSDHFPVDVTYVRTVDKAENSALFTTRPAYINHLLSVEACQSTLQVIAAQSDLTDTAQEIVCNSFATGYDAKQSGLSYAQYFAWARKYTISIKGSATGGTPVIFDQKTYDSIPLHGPALTVQ